MEAVEFPVLFDVGQHSTAAPRTCQLISLLVLETEVRGERYEPGHECSCRSVGFLSQTAAESLGQGLVGWLHVLLLGTACLLSSLLCSRQYYYLEV